MKNTFLDTEDGENPRNWEIFTRAEQITELIDSLSSRKPFICKLESEAGYVLTFGLGPQAAFVQHSKTDGLPPYMVALGDGSISGLQSFLTCGTPTEIQEKYCITLSVLKTICAYFVETGKRSPAVSWEEI